MKTIKILFITTLFLAFSFIGMTNVHAATATVSARANKSTVVVGNSVTVTVTVSSSSSIGSWEFVVGYDSSRLRLTSSSFGNTYVADVASNSTTKSKSYTYTFRALKAGSTSVTVKDALVIGWDEKTMSTKTSNSFLTLVNPTVVVLSENNNLESLSVSKGTLAPEFKVGTLEYTVDINELVNTITINAKADHNKATVNGAGEVAVSEGANAFEIKVTAENGDSKIYKLTVNVVDENPIEVTLDGVKYKVIKTSGTIDMPKNYKETTIMINGIEVVAYENELNKLTLVGLKNEEGFSFLYVYEDETYSLYNEFALGQTVLYIFKPDSDIVIPKGFKETTFKINEETIYGYTFNKGNKDFYLVYGMNVETGKASFYSYDSKELTFQRYNESIAEGFKEDGNIYIYIIIGIALLSVILIGICVLLLRRYNKLQNKIKEARSKKIEEVKKATK